MKGYLGWKVDALMERREEICRRYLEVLRRADGHLTEGPIIWLNLIERVGASTLPWIAAGYVLPRDLESFLNGEHRRRTGSDVRPVTRRELEADEAERLAAYQWAAEVICDPRWGPKFAVFIEDLQKADGTPAEALALRCWPRQTKLTPASAHWFYGQQLALAQGRHADPLSVTQHIRNIVGRCCSCIGWTGWIAARAARGGRDPPGRDRR